jgi:hypothetical protein
VAYNEARSRIFLDFEKTKEKDNDMSASSSTFSLVSGSASTSGGGSSSAGDMDDSISTAPTESEFSGPVARDNKSERRNGSGANSAGSSRAMLPHKHPSSSRGSRASSPSLTYASIYDPGSNAVPYDASQAPPMQRPYPQQLIYHYPQPPQEQGPGQGFVQPIPYYSYGYPQPPQLPPQLPPHHASSSELPGPTADPQASGHFLPPAHHPQQMMYMAPPYSWAPNSAPVPPSAALSGTPSLPHPHPSQYSFAPPSTPQYGGYNIPPFYPPMGPMHTPAQGQQPLPQPTHPVGMSPLLQGNDLGIRVMPPITMNNDHVDPRGRKRGNSRNGSGSFSHGPMFGCSFGVSGVTGGSSPIENNTNIVGPRFNNSMRRTSGTSNGSRTPGDEASSVAVSIILRPLINLDSWWATPVIHVFVLPYYLFTASAPATTRLGRWSQAKSDVASDAPIRAQRWYTQPLCERTGCIITVGGFPSSRRSAHSTGANRRVDKRCWEGSRAGRGHPTGW